MLNFLPYTFFFFISHSRLAEKETELLLLKENVSALEAKIQETEEHNQLLRDEYQALNLTCNSYEEKNKKLIVSFQAWKFCGLEQ